MKAAKIRVERVRMTRIGLWYVLVTLIVAAAAVNTGNNALYLVESMMLALLAVSGLASRRNLRGVQLSFGPPGAEIYAGQRFSVPLTVRNRDRFLARRYLVLSGPEGLRETVIHSLPAGGERAEKVFLQYPRRGLHRIPRVRLASVFPFGLFDKAMLYSVDVEFLVFPRLLDVDALQNVHGGRLGEELARRPGWSSELRTLRPFRPGDDPRSIHWKRTARTGQLVFMEREAEEGRRLTILLDNAVGALDTEAARDRFEELVSEAASVAVHYMEQGFDVALTTRGDRIPFGRGRSHKLRLLEALALLQAEPLAQRSLWSGRRRTDQLRLGMSVERKAG